MFEFAEYSELY